MRFQILLLLVAGCGLLVGCDTTKEPAVAASRPAPVYGTGTVAGVVKFVGTAPARKEIVNKPCHDGAAGPLLDETVVVNGNGTLANVFVTLVGDGAPPSDGSAGEPAVLDQVDCRYVPHTVGVQVGQTLVLRSSDPTLHNVHYTPADNPRGNFGFTAKGSERKVTFGKPEFIRMKCDVHPWMTAYVGVFESPFFAVTREGEDEATAGKFEIARVPAGKYKLVAWHEQYGKVEQDVEVKDGGKADVTVTYGAPN